MLSGDGWLIRLRTSARALASHELRALARLARANGNGVIELTRRANLQLRGLRLESIPELRSELIALGLVDVSPLREARPALLVDPLAALAGQNIELARVLDEALAQSTSTGTLSAKLGIVLDAGSGSVSGIDADIRVAAREAAGRAQIYVGTHAGEQLLGECERAHAPGVVGALLAALASFAADSGTTALPPRMRDLLAARGVESVSAQLAPASAAASPALPLPAALGFHAAESYAWYGVGLPFGSASHADWLALAELAERFGAAEVRPTPARELLIVGVRHEVADRLARAAHAFGFITEDSDPRRRIVACSGAPACSSAHGETRSLASSLGEQLQPLLAAGATLHVSGCEKGCAGRAAAQLSVVLARGGARLALNADIAAASDAPLEPLASISAKLIALCSDATLTAAFASRDVLGAPAETFAAFGAPVPIDAAAFKTLDTLQEQVKVPR